MVTTIVLLTAIALVFGLLIYFVNRFVPHKVKGIEKTEEIASILPGANCTACGYPGCFALAQALTEDPNLVSECGCAAVLQDPESLYELQKVLGVTLDMSDVTKRALIHCNGNSEVIASYSGVQTCKAAAQILSGYKKCPFGCLGFGDCVKVCPRDAIFIQPENGVAAVDRSRCIGCGLCRVECPMNLIELRPATAKIGFQCNYATLRNIPGREKCDTGCIRCQRCVRACEYDAATWNKETTLPEFDIDKCVLCYKCIEECPNNTLGDFTIVKTAAQAAEAVEAVLKDSL